MLHECLFAIYNKVALSGGMVIRSSVVVAGWHCVRVLVYLVTS